jgi:hypothetical protein
MSDRGEENFLKHTGNGNFRNVYLKTRKGMGVIILKWLL